ncbi:MAG: DUF481 domain-containing protein [Bacteroidetes bacterium]|nr:DUF481 domain-containing protein [Bacteroidota bacterium]MBK7109509.1 DUF481 domain-containing protein [Bacteroidota bacterium]MBP9703112.1 DUF481 domain-containing protein [Chitinophagales bacterium]
MLLQKILLFLIIISSSLISVSQVVNVESYRKKTDTVGWAGSAEATLFINKNNDFVLALNTNIELQYKTKKTLWLMLTDLATVRANNDQRFVNGGFQHFRFNYKITDRFVLEAFIQGQFSEPLGINWRYLAGAGPRLKVFGGDEFRLYVAAAYMSEWEETTEVMKGTQYNRMSSYISFTYTPNDNVFIASTTYYQPRLDVWNDYRVSENLNIRTDITDKIYFIFDYTLLYDTRPPIGITTTAYILKSGFGLEF